MGEIKSTLDLVMERTKHLSMTDEEKAQQKNTEFEKKLNGLLTRYSDNRIPLEMLEEQILKLQTDLNVSDLTLVPQAVMKFINPDHNNSIWLDLMARIKSDVCKPLKDLFETYNEEKMRILNNSQQDVLDQLARNHGISGSAVLPNPEKDPQCREKLTALQNKVKEQIQAL